MNAPIKIVGAKGGGGSSQSAVRTPDTLRSEDTVEVVLALGEGQWKGLELGNRSFYVGDTQLQNENGDYNFPTIEVKFFPGDEDPDPVVARLGGTSTSNQVNLSMASGVAVTRQGSINNIDYIDVRIAFNALYRTDDNGTYTTSATLRVEYKPLSGSTWTKAFGQDMNINGKTTSTYVKEFRIAVPRINEPYEVRVTKISADSSTTYFSELTWESFQETISGNRTYPNTVLIQLLGKATDQFSSIPAWSGVYETMLIRVPSNYNPVTRVYTGMWDGSFQIAYSNNPAWCLYDFIMNDRYGIKSYYQDVNLDKYDVYEAGQWCDELVPDGKGGTQPRYTFNGAITEATPGKELARYIAGAFNSTFFDDLNGKSYLRVDKDESACQVFTPENVIDGAFDYSYTDITSRYNDITVTFLNPELNWEQDRRRIADDALIARYGRIPLDFIAVGCIEEHEALRRGYYKFITANTETAIVQFRTNRLGQFVNPFDVILICDPDMGYGISGRIKSVDATGQVITLRTPVYLEAGISYDIQFVLSDGTLFRTNLSSTIKGYNYSLTIGAALPLDLVPEKTVFTIEHATYIGLPRPFRVTKVEEIDGSPDQYLIEAVNINRNKWYDADNLVNTGTISYSVLPSPLNPPGPTSCSFSESYVRNSNEFQIVVSPVFDRGAYKYYTNDHSFEVWSRLAGTSETFVRRELRYGDTLVNHPAGLHDFKILGKSYLGKTTPLASAPTFEFQVANPKDPPKKVDWLKENALEFYWGYADPPDDFIGFVLRYQNQDGVTTWDDAIQPHKGVLSSTSYFTKLVPRTARVIMVRAIDNFGILSEESAILYRPLGDISLDNVYEQFDFHPTFAGTKTGCTVVSGVLTSTDTGNLFYSSVPTALFYDGGLIYESTYEEMTYQDAFTVTVNGTLIHDITFTGDGYEVSYRASGDTEWLPMPDRIAITPGDYEVKLRVFGGRTQGTVSAFTLYIEIPYIYEDIQDVTVGGTGIVRLPIQKTYSTIKIVNVIIQDDGSSTAMGYRVLDKDPVLGPRIELLNSTGAPVAGLIDAQIKGF